MGALAIAVADRNECEYCVAAHTMLGRKAGATSAEMVAAQQGESADPKTAAALRFGPNRPTDELACATASTW